MQRNLDTIAHKPGITTKNYRKSRMKSKWVTERKKNYIQGNNNTFPGDHSNRKSSYIWSRTLNTWGRQLLEIAAPI